jgi:cytochrome P450
LLGCASIVRSTGTSQSARSLRFEPPVTAIPRIALEDVPIRDQMISAGEIVQLSIAAANRDPSHFPDPDTFDAARNPHGVLTFGHGPHGCLGARLAKEQATIALEVLFRRLGTDFRLDPARKVRWSERGEPRTSGAAGQLRIRLTR